MYENEKNAEKMNRLINGLVMSVGDYINAKENKFDESAVEVHYLAMKGVYEDVVKQAKIMNAANTEGKIIQFPKL
jgi:hypothetical protein|nr:MAG TPA: hypothetical protein [Caudoviricetes sp.]